MLASFGIVPSEFSLAMISCGDMESVSTASREGVCDRDAVREEHFDTGLELRD